MILAGVALNLTIGQNGIISRAQDASEITTIANEKEAITLAYTACKMDDYQNDVSSQDLQDELNRNNHNTTVTPLGNNLRVLFNDTGHMYTVGQDGQVGDLTEEDLKKIARYGFISTTKIYIELLDGTVIVPKERLQDDGTLNKLDLSQYDIITTYGIKKEFQNGILDNAGNLYTWGVNYYGQVGDGTHTNREIPICLNEQADNAIYGKKIVDAEENGNTFIVLDDEGKVYTWGENYWGKIGDGTTESRNTPLCLNDENGNVLNGKKIKQIYNGYISMIVLDENKKMYAWGNVNRKQ